jgi:hypothetical protein
VEKKENSSIMDYAFNQTGMHPMKYANGITKTDEIPPYLYSQADAA